MNSNDSMLCGQTPIVARVLTPSDKPFRFTPGAKIVCMAGSLEVRDDTYARRIIVIKESK